MSDYSHAISDDEDACQWHENCRELCFCPHCGMGVCPDCVDDHIPDLDLPVQGPLWRRVDAFLDSPVGVPLVWFGVLAVGLASYGVMLRVWFWFVA